MGFLKNYGMYKAITGKTKNDRLMGVILASMDSDCSKDKNKNNNSKSSKYDKYGRIIKNKEGR